MILDWCSKHQPASANDRYSVGFCKKKTNLHLQSNGTHFCNSCLWHNGFLNSCLLTYVVGMIMASAGEMFSLQQPLGHSGSERSWGNGQEAVRWMAGTRATLLYQVGLLGPTRAVDVKVSQLYQKFQFGKKTFPEYSCRTWPRMIQTRALT